MRHAEASTRRFELTFRVGSLAVIVIFEGNARERIREPLRNPLCRRKLNPRLSQFPKQHRSQRVKGQVFD